MEARSLATLVSSLVSQALLLVLLIFHSKPNILLPSPLSRSLSALLQLLSSCHHTAAAAISMPHSPSHLKRLREMDELESEGKEGEDEEEGDDRRRVIDETTLFFPHQNLDEFKLQFGMRSTTFEWLACLLDPLIDSRDPSGSPLGLPTSTRIALAIGRLATGTSYSDLAARFSVSEPIARFCARQLCRVLCTNFRFWLAFPSSPELLLPVSEGFFSLTGLPGCCGAIASARFQLKSGPASAFLVSDVSSRILSFIAVFRGDPPEFEVFKQSSLYKKAVEGRLLGPDQYLVGDENHFLFPWLMVPFAKPAPGSCEEDFNLSLRVMCWPARRAIYSLHSWKVLSHLEEETTKVAMAYIGTCAILHNILLMKEDSSALVDVGSECLLSSVHYRDADKHAADQNAVLLRSTLAVRAREFGAL